MSAAVISSDWSWRIWQLQAEAGSQERVEILLCSLSGNGLQSAMNLIFTHTHETSFMPHDVLVTKDVIAGLANAPLADIALSTLVNGSALTQLCSFSKNISHPAFPGYVTIISSRKLQENW